MADQPREFKSVHRPFTPEEKARFQKAKREVEHEVPEIAHAALIRKQEVIERAEAMRVLKREREARGLSLADVAERSGVDVTHLAEWETDPYPNPSLDTLSRIAHAIGVRLTVGVTTT